MRKLAFPLVVFAFSALNTHGQKTGRDIDKSFNQYNKNFPTTKIHLIFNQDKFYPGDTLFFKCYFLYNNNQGVQGRQIINFDLVDANGKSIIHLYFLTLNGIGQNQVILPDNLRSGIYNAVAYSSWMKNFEPPPVFKKEIQVVRAGELKLKDQGIFAMPEGGHLIAGVPNKISIRSKPNTTIKLVDQFESILATTELGSEGLGHIALTPLNNTSYFLQVDASENRMALPLPEQENCTLQYFSSPDREYATIKVLHAPGSSLKKTEHWVVVSSADKIYQRSSILLSDGSSSALQIKASDFPAGVFYLSLLSESGKLESSRCFYLHSKADSLCSIQLNKSIFKNREKIRLSITTTDDNHVALPAEFSVKVTSKTLLDTRDNPLADELSIFASRQTKLHLYQNSAEWYASLDDYLILESPVLPWNSILFETAKTPEFRFTNFPQFSGRVVNAATGKLVTEGEVYFYLQNSRLQYKAKIENGKIWVAFPELMGDDEMLYYAEQPFYQGGELYGEELPMIKIIWDQESLVALPPARSATETDKTDHYASYASSRAVVANSFTFFGREKLNEVKQKNRKKSTAWDDFVKPDITINVSDYVVFSTMAEYIKEVIPSLQYRQIKKRNRVMAALLGTMVKESSGDPLFIIDGSATKDTEFFLSLKPVDLLSIGVVITPEKLIPLKNIGKNGIVIVHTKAGNIEAPNPDSNRFVQGPNLPIPFKDNTYKEDQKYEHSPTFRSTMYWNPSVKSDSNGKATIEFNCTDDIGDFEIRIDGINKNGRAFSVSKEIKVSVDGL